MVVVILIVCLFRRICAFVLLLFFVRCCSDVEEIREGSVRRTYISGQKENVHKYMRTYVSISTNAIIEEQ